MKIRVRREGRGQALVNVRIAGILYGPNDFSKFV